MSDVNLHFRLLGGHVIQHLGKNITLALPHKGRALLVYLLLTGRKHGRKEIANLLWPDAGTDKALRSLRVLLNTLRNKHQLTPFIKTDRFDIKLDHLEEIWCDVIEFHDYIDDAKDAIIERSKLQAGLDLYLGKFMLGFDVTNTAFDDWLYQQQIVLEEKALHGLVKIIDHDNAVDNPREAIEYAYRLVEIDPWREASYRRLMSVLARNDRADAALFAYDACCKILQQELGLMPEQETVLLANQIKQNEIEVVQSESLPTLPEPSEVPFLAPAFHGPFVGREQILDRLTLALLNESGHFRTCITGMGGIGKTALALQLAHQLRPHFPDGVLWADAAQQEPLTIVEHWAAAFGLDLHKVKNENERLIALRTILAEKRALIIFDDVSRAAAVRPLFPGNGKCKLLFTSRNADVARLLDAQPVRLEGLSVENGRSLLSHFILPQRASQEPKAVTTICELLHHMPLAIVIAGNYLLERQHLRLADFVTQLETATQKLDISNANRQVRATFNISWEALHAEEKLYFRMLGVFNGRHFSVEAFAAISELDAFAAEAQLQTLVQYSLLNRVENGRFRQHPLLAEFAGEKLSQQDPVFHRIVDYFLVFATQNQNKYESLHPEWENLNASIEIAYRYHQWAKIVNFTNTLQKPWFARGRYSDAQAAFAFASDAAMYLEDESELAKVHFNWGLASLEQSDYEQAKTQLDKSLHFYQDENNEFGVGNIHYELSRIAINQGDYEKADALLAASQQIREKQSDNTGLAEIYYRKARVHLRQGQYEIANQLCQDALIIHEESENYLGIIRTLRLMTSISTMLKDYDASLNHAERALLLAEKLDDSGETAMAYYSLSIAHHNKNDLEKALTFANESLAKLKKLGDMHSLAQVTYHKCLIYKAAAKFEQAITAANEALEHFRRLKDQLYIILALGHSGDCYEAMMQKQAACQNWHRALVVAESIQDQRLIQALQNRLQNCGNL